MSINNDKKEKKRIVFEFPSDLFGKSKKGNDNTELMKTIKQELKNKEDYKPELTVLEKYKLGIELLLSLSVREFEKAKELIKMGANVNAKDEEGNTSIMFAAQNAPIEILKLLIENDAKINIRNHEGKTPLILAATFNKKEILEFLINNGAQVDETDYAGETPLMYASEFYNFENVEKLIEMGAYIKHVDNKGRNALMHTFMLEMYENNDQIEISKYLIKNGVNIRERDVYGRNIMHYIVENGDLSTLKYFILNHDLNSSEEEMFSYFEKSIGKNEKTKYLLEYIIDNFPVENTIDKIIDLKLNGESINVQLIKIIIEETGMINEKNSEGNTLLHAACERKDLNSIEYLIENGANITIKNHDGKTPYMLAFEKSDDETIEKIIEILNKNNQEELAFELQEMLNHGFKIEYNNIELSDEYSYQSNSFEEEFVNRYNGRIVDMKEALGEKYRI